MQIKQQPTKKQNNNKNNLEKATDQLVVKHSLAITL